MRTAALMVGVTCLFAMSDSAFGQTPKVYVWSIPTGTDPLVGSPNFKYALREPVGIWLPADGQTVPPCDTPHPSVGRWSTPEEDAQRIRCKLFQKYAGKIDPNDFALILQNFGIDNNVIGVSPASLLRQPDAVDVDEDDDGEDDWPQNPSTVPNAFDPDDRSRDRRNPWMTNGRQVVGDWMGRFLTEYNNTSPLPAPPTRFHFDSEEYLIGTKPNYAFLLKQLSVDGNATRWHNAEVPGFFGLKMADLWQQAKDDFGGTSPVAPWNGTLESVVQHTVPVNQFRFLSSLREPPRSQYNRDIFLWYYDVTQRALDGAMKQVAYDPIKIRFPNAKVSDYYDTLLLRGQAEHGWHLRITKDVQCPVPPVPAGSSDIAWSRTSPRGSHDYFQDGHRLETIPTTGSKPLHWRVISDHRSSGDFSAPVLYPVGVRPLSGPDDCSNPRSWRWYEQRNPYLKDHPREGNRWLTSLRHNRWWLESIMSSHEDPASPEHVREPWLLIAPWIALPGSEPDGDKVVPGYPVTDRDTLLQLGLLRHKRVPEMIVWDNIRETLGRSDVDLQNALITFKAQYDRVFGSQLISATRSGGIQQPFPFCDTTPLERLNDTNRRANCEQSGPIYTFSDYMMTVNSSTVTTPSASLVATYTGFPTTWDVEDTVRLYFEAAIDVPVSASGSLIGRVSLWSWADQQWRDLRIEDDCQLGNCDGVSDEAKKNLRAFAPAWIIGEGPAAYDRREIRRRFDIEMQDADGFPQFISSTGRLRVKYTFTASAPFVAHFDLAQAHRILLTQAEPETPEVRVAWIRPAILDNPIGLLGMQADINYSNSVDAVDLLDFADAFATGQTIADYNLDNAVDPADMDAFLNDYTGGN